MDSAFFLVVVERKNFFSRKKFVVWCILAPCRLAAKPFVLDDFVLGMGTSVASALTAETIFEIVKCIADVDMLPRGRMQVKMRNFQVFQFWLRPR